MCSLKYIYSGLDFINGGQLKEYEQAVINFVNKFEALGARLVFFFDGPHKEGKRDTWKKRRLGALALMLNLLDNLENGKLVSSFKTDEIICLPVGVREVLFRTVKYVCGCEVRVALKECDEEIARYAKKNKCLAILSQDTDFIIYDSARYYLSMKFLEIQNMSTLVYDRYALAENLKISTAHLPLLATSLGNDIVPNEMLKVCMRKIIVFLCKYSFPFVLVMSIV
ncbi:hypothetical protein AAG570_003101 [Ranatra chinensis]|uniref:XPG-I domain-containing protein n=1 Tax=Ranatra chinensis TaxID=642074 RepID=A0ABD0YUA2_9HEMI